MFFAEAEYSIIDEIKILPNPYTNIKEHISYRFIDKDEFESDLTPDYLKDYFHLALNKIKDQFDEKNSISYIHHNSQTIRTCHRQFYLGLNQIHLIKIRFLCVLFVRHYHCSIFFVAEF